MLGKKIPTLLAIVLLLLTGVAIVFWQKSRSSEVSTSIIPKSVKITNISDNKFSVSWKTEIATKGAIEYGSVGEKLSKQVKDDRGNDYIGLTHHITITDLQPGTNYGFRLLSGDSLRRFDNNGSVYTVTTGATIASVPAARSLYGDISGGSEDTLVYITLPDAQPASLTLNKSGSYSIPISTIRSANMKSFVSYDPSATIVSMIVDNGKVESQVTVSTTNMSPVPTITMGSNADFRMAANESVAQTPQVAQTTPVQIFNVEPLSDASINAITDTAYTLTNPATEGEVLATTKPEFRGTGTANAEIQIAITGQKNVTDTLRIAANNNWTWTPAIALPLGKQKITISYKDKDGKAQTIVRSFSITADTATSQPAFVATSSANANGNSATLSASPRSNLPATESGIPVTGVMTPTLLTGALGFAIMVVGALLMAF